MTLNTLTTWWQERVPRERLALLIMLGVIVGGGLLQLLWNAHHARQRLQRELPALRAELATMHSQANEWQRLRGAVKPAPGLQGEALEATVRASLSKLAASGANLNARLTGSRQITLQGAAPFDAWAEWLAQMQSTQQLSLVRGDIRRHTQAGWVQIDAELAGSD
jgi:type II secretory pathway component PulM